MTLNTPKTAWCHDPLPVVATLAVQESQTTRGEPVTAIASTFKTTLGNSIE